MAGEQRLCVVNKLKVSIMRPGRKVWERKVEAAREKFFQMTLKSGL